MRIHHFNCMTFTTVLKEITHCMLVESSDGLVLIDTGMGRADYTQRPWRINLLVNIERIPCELRETAVHQVTKLGYTPADVRHIVLTHLHSDHSGGMPDFPDATVHVHAREYEAAMHPRWNSLLDLVGYEPSHWAHNPDWAIHNEAPRPWFNLEAFPLFKNGKPEIMMVPLFGHTPGHCGVAVRTDQGWLLHCGDAFVRECHVHPHIPSSPFPGWYAPIERYMFPFESRLRIANLLRSYSSEVKVFSAHDPLAFAQLQGVPVDRIYSQIDLLNAKTRPLPKKNK